MYLQTSQYIFVHNIRPPVISKQFFYLFEFSYLIFPISSYFCCRMVTLPVTPKKEGQENYFPQRRNCWENKFFSIYFCNSIPQIFVLWKEFIQFVSIIVFCSCKSKIFLQKGYPSSTMLKFTIYLRFTSAKVSSAIMKINGYFKFIKFYSFQEKQTEKCACVAKFYFAMFQGDESQK